MRNLKTILRNINHKEAIKIEELDPQFLSLKNMYSLINNKNYYLSLIIINSLICYQLSSKWEDYWQEFSEKAGEYIFNIEEDIFTFFEEFLPHSKWNKRLLQIKIKRIKKIKEFIIQNFLWRENEYYEDMIFLRDELAINMNQKKTAKTIVFAVKMFSYGARNYFAKLVEYPYEIDIPIDSRLTNIYKKFWKLEREEIKEFYNNLSKTYKLPPLLLDAVIWCKYDKIMEEKK